MLQKRMGKMQSAVKQYYNINKIFLSQVGGWPTQSTFMKILLPTIITSFIFSMVFLEFIKLSETWRTIMNDCECLIMLVMASGIYTKLFGIILNSENIEQLLSLIDYHWRYIFTHSLERKIMHDYAIVGRKMTIGYAVGVYILMNLYMLIPVAPKLLNLVKPLNESRPNGYLFDVEYSFDKDNYYYAVLVHSYLITIMGIGVLVVIDTIYLVFAQHACSLFAAIGQRLENLGINSKESNFSNKHVEIVCEKHGLADYVISKEDDDVYREFIHILQKHQLSIKYVSILNYSFSLYSLMLLFINIMATSLLGVQILILMEHKEQMARFVSMIIGSFMHLLVLSYPGQKIIDHTTNLFYKAYDIQWYKMSRRSAQILRILLYRCDVPCTLTAGKIYVLSMANYASVVRACLSYFTAFSSFS